jgi:rubrerythrin
MDTYKSLDEALAYLNEESTKKVTIPHWIVKADGIYCSNCNKVMRWNKDTYPKTCPSCKAKMENPTE